MYDTFKELLIDLINIHKKNNKTISQRVYAASDNNGRSLINSVYYKNYYQTIEMGFSLIIWLILDVSGYIADKWRSNVRHTHDGRQRSKDYLI